MIIADQEVRELKMDWSFEERDEFIFKIARGSLRMRFTRMPSKIFTLPLPTATRPWFVYVSVGASEVELLPASHAETNLL